MIEDENNIRELKKIEMKSILKMAAKSIQHESDADYVDPLILQEEYKETIREERFYNLLTNDEKERWEVIRRLFTSRDFYKENQYFYHVESESEFLDSYFAHAGLDTDERRAYLKTAGEKYIEIITKHSFGRELLDNFTIEKYLSLFNEIDEFRPKDIQIRSEFEKKSEAEIREDLIEYGGKLKAVLRKLSLISNSGLEYTTILDSDNNLSIQSIEVEKEKPKKLGRKPTIVKGDFSIKDVASADQINALNKLLLKNVYVEEVNGSYIYTQSTAKSFAKFATIIKHLGDYGYSTKIIAKQAYHILTNDYNVNTAESTVKQANDKSALSLLKNNRFLENDLK